MPALKSLVLADKQETKYNSLGVFIKIAFLFKDTATFYWFRLKIKTPFHKHWWTASVSCPFIAIGIVFISFWSIFFLAYLYASTQA